MSNFRAIATVTATLKDLLQETAGSDVHQVIVSTGRPIDVIGGISETDINIYLYQVTPNAALRNADLPTRRADTSMVHRPQVALDLHYMISFYGDESGLVPQLLLGSVVRTLHAQPVLTREMIRSAINNAATSPHLRDALRGSNLAEQIELVKFSPLHLSLEELSKIWSVFFQIPYTLSVAYQGTVVLIESDDLPQSAPPARVFRSAVGPFSQPVIEQIAVRAGTNQPVRPDMPIILGSTLLFSGRQLQGRKGTVLQIDGIEVKPTPKNVSDTLLTLPLMTDPQESDLQASNLCAGVQGIQVIHLTMEGTPPVAHHGVASNIAAFVLRPVIVPINGQPATVELQDRGDGQQEKVVNVMLTPAAGKAQRAVLFLNEIGPNKDQPLDHPPHAYSIEADPRLETGDTLTFPASGILPGTYLIRVQVDGAESLLDVDTDTASTTFNLYTGTPQVEIS
jgi:hypothetical protein